MTKTFAAAVALLLACAPCRSQESEFVSQEEYNHLKTELTAEFSAQLKAERTEFEKELAALKAEASKQSETSGSEAEVAAESTGPKEVLAPVLGMPVLVSPGVAQLTLTGGASASYASHGAENQFLGAFNPIFLWEINNRVRVDGDIVFGTRPFNGDASDLNSYQIKHYEKGTHTQIQAIELSWDLCDYLTLSGGRFANPADYFVANLRKEWVNELPTAPQGRDFWDYVDGVHLHGAIPLGGTRLTYSGFYGRSYADLPYWGLVGMERGGWHLGFEPAPGIELGYGGTVESIHETSHFADLNFTRNLDWLGGAIRFHGQWKWETWGGNFGYAQLGYQPKKLGPIFGRFEPVVRFETQNGIYPTGLERWTFGLDYWLTERSVIKAAYEYVAHPRFDGEQDRIYIQVATGF